MPNVSIIVNCHNGEKYLRQAIDSIFSQTYTDWEVIFWNNASTDESLNIAKSYGQRLRIYNRDKLTSLGEARQLAMREARGKFIAFLDTDDVWLEDHLVTQVAFMERTAYLASYAGIQEIDGNGNFLREVLPEFSSGNQLRNILRQFEINVPTMMLHRSLIFDHGFSFNSSITIVEEFDLFLRIAADHDIGVIRQILAKYRVHDGGLTQSTSLIAANERNRLLCELINQRPDLYQQNMSSFSAAFSRSAYYKAKSYAMDGNMSEARAAFRKHKNDNVIYFVIYLSFHLPRQIWKVLEIDNIRRSALGTLLTKRLIRR